MRSPRQTYYDLFSKIYDLIIRLHSRDTGGSLRNFIAHKANLSKGDKALDLCTGTGSVAIELAKRVGEKGLVVGLDFSQGMLQRLERKLEFENRPPIWSGERQSAFKKSPSCGYLLACLYEFRDMKGLRQS
jgi:ubiquinone/menaquinone biosynthesis C-methylase UbiE